MNPGEMFSIITPLVERLPAVRAVLGFILVFFLPGFAWTFVFFKKINVIERIALAVGLSIAMVTLAIIVLNVLLDIKITGMNALIVIIVLAIIPLAIHYLKKLRERTSESPEK